MRTIHRDIVGAFIFSADGKVLLGTNKKGGAYQGQILVPGGGIEEGETKKEAMVREILEETGIDVSNERLRELEGTSLGESEKELEGTREKVLVKMKFHDFEVCLSAKAKDVNTKEEDYSFSDIKWYSPEELSKENLVKATRVRLQDLKFI